MRNFVIKTLMKQGKVAVGDAGINKDTVLSEFNPNTNYGAQNTCGVAFRVGGGVSEFAVIGIRNLTKYVDGVDPQDIISIILEVQGTGGFAGMDKMRVTREAETNWKELEATWIERIFGANWKNTGGVDTNADVVDGVTIPPNSVNWFAIDLTPIKEEELIDVIMWANTAIHGPPPNFDVWAFWSCDHATPAIRPKITWQYRVWSPDGFKDQESKLRIEPWTENPHYPRLYWGKIDPDPSFTVFKVWRKNASFTKPVADGATLLTPTGIADITLTEYVDTTMPNTGTFYYMVTAESTDNAGDDATLSNVASLVVPLPSAVTVPAGAITPGTFKTISLSPNKLTKKYRIDWGDGTISWYELETATSSPISVSHLYISHGVFTVRGMFEDTDGFWSDWVNGSTTVTVNDTTPLAKLQVNINKELVGVNVILNATLSQPISSLATIINYKFRRYGGDPYFDNGANPIYKFSSSTIPIGVKTAEVLITTSTGPPPGLQAIATCDYELYTETAEALGLTRYSSINSIKEDAGSFDIDVQIPIGGTGTEYDNVNSKKAMRITVNGITTRSGTASDIDRLRTIYNSRKLVKITSTTFKRGTTVEWTGKIESEPKFNNMSPNAVSWSFTMKVYSRSPAV